MMRLPQHNAGFALPEVLLSLVLTGVLLGGFYQGYLWLQRAWTDWNRQYTLHADVHRILTRWVRDVTYATRWTAEADTAWTLVQAEGQRIRYALRDTVLFRSNRPMHHGKVYFKLFEVAAANRAGPARDTLDGPGVWVRAHMEARAWQYTVRKTVDTTMRPPGPWPDLHAP